MNRDSIKSKKLVFYFLLITIILINIIFRYPLIPHQIGSDSFAINVRTNSISDKGYISWYLNPLSLIGHYPYSYPTGEMMLLSAINLLTGYDMQSVIYLSSLIFSIIGILTTFMVSKSLFNNNYLSLVLALTFPLMYKVHLWTYWRVSTRGLFMMLTPILIYSLIGIYRNKRYSYMMFVVMIFTLFSIHRMAIAIVPHIIIPFLIGLLYRRFKALSNTTLIANIESRIKVNTILFLLFISTSFLILLSDSFTLAEKHSGAYTFNIFGSNDDPLIEILNLVVDYEKFLGLMMTFCIFGVFSIFFKRNKKPEDIFFMSFLFLTPLSIMDLEYFLQFAAPLFVLVIGYGLTYLLEKRLIHLILVIFLPVQVLLMISYFPEEDSISAVILSFGIIIFLFTIKAHFEHVKYKHICALAITGVLITTSSYELHRSMVMPHRDYIDEHNEVQNDGTYPFFDALSEYTYDTALWTKSNNVEYLTDNGRNIALRINAVSETSVDPLQFQMSVAEIEVIRNYTSIELNLSKLIKNPKSAYDNNYYLENTQYTYYPSVEYVFHRNDKRYIELYQISYIVEHKEIYGFWHSHPSELHGNPESSFLLELHESHYKVYENSLLVIGLYKER